MSLGRTGTVPFSNGTTGLGALGLWIFIGFERAEVAKAQVMTTLMRIWSMVEDELYWRSADVKVYPQEATRCGSYQGLKTAVKSGGMGVSV